MLPLQDELLVSFFVADRLAEAERSRLVRACAACARRAAGRIALLNAGRLLIRLGAYLEVLGGERPNPRPPDVRPSVGF